MSNSNPIMPDSYITTVLTACQCARPELLKLIPKRPPTTEEVEGLLTIIGQLMQRGWHAEGRARTNQRRISEIAGQLEDLVDAINESAKLAKQISVDLIVEEEG